MVKVNPGTTGGSVNTGIPTKLRFVPRQVETDSETRHSDRKEVTMLPASTAIINVYQLVDKVAKGGTVDRRGGKNQSGRQMSGNSKEAVKSGARPSGRVAQQPSRIFEGRFIDKNGDLIPLKGETESQYHEHNKKQRGEERRLQDEEGAEKQAKFREDLARQTGEAGQKLSQNRRESPKGQLLKRISTDRISYSHEVKRWEQDKRYHGVVIDTPEDITSINKAIDNMIAEGRTGEIPPAIVAVGTGMNSPTTTRVVYIKRDLRKLRGKKITHSKVKRPVHQGNSKKRVVLKKKGGKR